MFLVVCSEDRSGDLLLLGCPEHTLTCMCFGLELEGQLRFQVMEGLGVPVLEKPERQIYQETRGPFTKVLVGERAVGPDRGSL